jgi:PIN domain nuclease of toxin-antitoxin system
LDASAVLALLYQEPGHEAVLEALDGAALSAVNLAEVVTKLVDNGDTEDAVRSSLGKLPIRIVAVDDFLAYEAGLLRRATRSLGFSLGDRCCLALAKRLGFPALTTDRLWLRPNLDIQVQVIR